MHITKIGHCCLLIKTNNLTILTDPGAYTSAQNAITGIDIVLITHEHPDHLHTESLKQVLQNNPQAQVITNAGVGKKLDEAGIAYTVLEGRNQTEIGGVSLQAFDCAHEEVFEEIGQVQNTGYFIDNKLFYPGDSYADPQKHVPILALPVAGPWCRIAEAIRYAIKLKPERAFPVHDGMLQPDRIGASHKVPEIALARHGIEFVVMKEGEERGF